MDQAFTHPSGHDLKADMVKEIFIRETAGIDRINEYIRVAVPFARGELQPNTPLSITDPKGQVQLNQARTLKQWPDGSVKWLLVGCGVSVSAGRTAIYQLVDRKRAPTSPAEAVQVTPGADFWQVDTGSGVFTIDARIFRPFAMIRRKENGEVLGTGGSSCLLSIDGTTGIMPTVEQIRLEDSGPISAIVRMCGRLELPNRTEMRFQSRIHFYSGSLAVKIEFTIYNPQTATHPAGLWDLGDPGSILFRELAISFRLSEGATKEIHCTPEKGTFPSIVSHDTQLSIYQESSGGERWQSPAHRNREGRVPMGLRGYVIETGGCETASGMRATPQIWCGGNGIGVAAALPHFWQEFPKAIEAAGDQLKISLFPSRFADMHELQGGEQKTHVMVLDFASRPDDLAWALSPVQASISPLDYRSSGIFFDLPDEDDLFNQFSSATDILAKREHGDEYGWRNFGEVYADHEAVFHQGAEPFVSHYNNQYDFCASAYRKFFATGDPQWKELASDLARHVLDIDIYHTDRDREEYNHGLFWHTDHYLDAGLASHRSYSREHLKSKDYRFCGGGPGVEHCYTTGLMYHYFQTGDPAFKDAVVGLAEWVLRSLNGPQTLLAAVKRGVGHMKLLRAARGNRKLFPRYPFTRGTGNAITACLDAFEVGGGRRFLDEAEKLVRESMHPGDDIAARNLHDAERSWSYTVLLVAVAKFIDKKRELDEFDSGFSYARACLITYAEWMLDNEYPYLEKPEILEYPNETWPAQDLRKSVIFYQAGRYARPERRELYWNKARYFHDSARDDLLRHETSSLARPLVLILQNGWVGSRLHGEGSRGAIRDYGEISLSGRPTPYLALGPVAARICSELAGAWKETSVQREIMWLQARMKNGRNDCPTGVGSDRTDMRLMDQ